MKLEKYISEKRKIVDKWISAYLNNGSEHPLSEIFRYSMSGGKRFRPILVISAAEACGLNAENVIPAAIAIEMIHNFSLIHDDLPCMDNDEYRRDRETCHKKFGETEALLAGDGLLIEAFNVLSKNTENSNISPGAILKVVELFSRSAGHLGMTGGQVLDMRYQGQKRIEAEVLEEIHSKKTGALITSSVLAGGILAEASKDRFERLKLYGERIGLTYQIIDDILDLGEDHQTISFPAVFGLEKSREMARKATEEAVSALDIFDERAEPLRQLAVYLLNRSS
ncbi:MAG: polyprenyl synthetase family protein [Candidatus Eremiobacteraeota bacterium]|nr:polyprenyl synthetase family protein [Candidatus Eremiobacteraeota bacterium]